MPSRVVRGEINESSSLGGVSEGAELLFRKLLNAADDFGRYEGDAELLAAYLYPRRRSMTADDIEERLHELAHADGDGQGPIHLFEVGGHRYIWLVNWEQHRSNSKRGTRSKWPLPLKIPEHLEPPADYSEPADDPDPQAPPDPHGGPREPEGPHAYRRGPARGDEVTRCRGNEVSNNITSPPAPRLDALTDQAWPELREIAASVGVTWAEKPGKAQRRLIGSRIRDDGLSLEDLKHVLLGYLALRGTEVQGEFDPLKHFVPKTLFRASNWPDYLEAGRHPPQSRQPPTRAERTVQTGRDAARQVLDEAMARDKLRALPGGAA